MSKTALIATRDESGVDAFSAALSGRWGYRLLGLEGVCGSDLETIDWEGAGRMLRAGEVDLLVANFYDPAQAGREFLSWRSALKAFDHELVDLIRLAARQPSAMAVLGNPKAYVEAERLLAENDGGLTSGFRMERACAALHAVSRFDATVAQYVETQGGEAPDLDALAGFPKTLSYSWRRGVSLSEGETGRQKAALYGSFEDHLEVVSGPELDYRSIADSSLAAFIIGEFEKATAVFVRKGVVVAMASGRSAEESALARVLNGAGVELRGATLAVNESIGTAEIAELESRGVATVIAPSFLGDSEESNLRRLAAREGLGFEALHELRSVVGGVLIQDRNRVAVNPFSWRLPSANQPRVEDWDNLLFGVKLSRHLRSSACVAVGDERLLARAEGMVRQTDFERLVTGSDRTLENAALVFDEDISEPVALERAHSLGFRVVAHPGLDVTTESELVESANTLGLALVATGVSFTRF